MLGVLPLVILFPPIATSLASFATDWRGRAVDIIGGEMHGGAIHPAQAAAEFMGIFQAAQSRRL